MSDRQTLIYAISEAASLRLRLWCNGDDDGARAANSIRAALVEVVDK